MPPRVVRRAAAPWRFPHRRGRACLESALRDIYEHHGFRLEEHQLFGLGAGLHFDYSGSQALEHSRVSVFSPVLVIPMKSRSEGDSCSMRRLAMVRVRSVRRASMCRADRARTCNLRFWRPLLYQLSHRPMDAVASIRGGVEPSASLDATSRALRILAAFDYLGRVYVAPWDVSSRAPGGGGRLRARRIR